MVMEFLPGGDLMGLLMKYDTFDENSTRVYMAETAMAIARVSQSSGPGFHCVRCCKAAVLRLFSSPLPSLLAHIYTCSGIMPFRKERYLLLLSRNVDSCIDPIAPSNVSDFACSSFRTSGGRQENTCMTPNNIRIWYNISYHPAKSWDCRAHA